MRTPPLCRVPRRAPEPRAVRAAFGLSVGVLLLLSPLGCMGIVNGPSATGNDGAACLPDQTCNAGLTCDQGTCVARACAGATCSGHGTCVAAGGSATCRCAPGYHDDQVSCVQDGCISTPHAASACDSGSLYWFDSCGLRQEVAQDCVAGCTDAACNPDPCDGVSCASPHGRCTVVAGHAACDCASGWHANGLSCEQDICTPASHASSACDAGNVYWFDSCGSREELKESCTFGCSGAACGRDPCVGETCTSHGTCASTRGTAYCRCDPTYHPVGLTCQPDGSLPPVQAGKLVDIADPSGLTAIKSRDGGLGWCFDITVEDIDADDHNDILIGEHGPNRRLAFGDGQGLFTEPVKWSSTDYVAQTWSQLAYDYDNDGLTDFSQNWDSADFPIIRNLGGRTFAVKSPSSSIATGSNGMAWSDWNGDAVPDYVVNNVRGGVGTYRGTGNGKYAKAGGFYGLYAQADETEATIFLADLTGDDKPDLLMQPLVGDIFGGGGLTTKLAENTTAVLGGTASFSNVTSLGLDTLPGPGVALGDYDNDGDLDIFGMGSDPSNSSQLRYGLFRNDGTGHFTEVTAGSGLPTASRAIDVYMALYLQSVFLDYDGDGFLDIFVAEESHDRLFRNQGNGTFEEVTSSVGLDGARIYGRPARFHSGDLDGDYDVDVVTTRFEEGAGGSRCDVQLWRNDASPANGLIVKLIGKNLKNALNSKLYLYEAQAGGGNGPLVGYREVILSTSHRAPIEQHFGLPAGKIYNLRVKFWPSGTIVDRLDVRPGRIVLTEP